MKTKGLFISDFTIDNFSNLFKTKEYQSEFEILSNPNGAVIYNLLNFNYTDVDFCVIWTQPQSTVSSFNSNHETKIEEIHKSVDYFSEILLKIAKKVGILFIPSWTNNPYQRGLGFNDFEESGITRTILEMNHRLINNLHNKDNNIFILDTNRWVNKVGVNSFDSRLWYLSKTLFNTEIFKLAQDEVLVSLKALRGQTKKIIFLDLDNTLWGGLLVDDGVENLRIGGHDSVGEAYLDFQRTLLNLKNRGVILAIVSKNDEKIALDAIENNPAMLLKKIDFSSWKINWRDKAENIRAILDELNLSSNSAVFFDDSPVERSRVKQALPDVFVPELPSNPLYYNIFINRLDCFDSLSKTQEDVTRAQKYKQETDRNSLKEELPSLEDWISSLNIKINVSSLSEANLKRSTQLLNKTNQMNLSSRRLFENDFIDWSHGSKNSVLTLNIKDKYGDYGLTGILSMVIKDRTLVIVDYVLSCRVLGRKIEESMIQIAYKVAIQDNNIKEIHFPLTQTKKNNACILFFKRSGLVFDKKNNIFIWNMRFKYDSKSSILIEYK